MNGVLDDNKALLLILLSMIITMWFHKNIFIFLRMHVKILEIKMCLICFKNYKQMREEGMMT